MSARATIAARRLRVTLEEPVEAADAIGGVSRTFTPRITLWARLEPATLADRAEADRGEAVVTHRLTLRWRTDLTTAMRLAAGPRRFAIHGWFDPDGRRRDLVVRVEEVQS